MPVQVTGHSTGWIKEEKGAVEGGSADGAGEKEARLLRFVRWKEYVVLNHRLSFPASS